MTEWRMIYDGAYELSSDGQVRRLSAPYGRTRTGRMLTPSMRGDYLTVTLCNDGKRKVVRLHELVATTFIGPKPSPRHQVNHLDGIKTNVKASNLEWGTQRHNLQHAYDNHLNHSGDMHHWTTISDATVREVRQRRKTGESVKMLSAVYGISERHVRSLVNGTARRHTR